MIEEKPKPQQNTVMGPFCQSCGMPMVKPEDFGALTNGLKNNDYCNHCFQNGEFTEPKVTLQEMQECATKHMIEDAHMLKEQAGCIANEFIPTLKRWNK